MKQFLIDAGEAFLIAAGVVLVLEGTDLFAVGSLEQLSAVGIALGRAAGVAGLRAVAPRVLALAHRKGVVHEHPEE